jgi:hypothetical protein
LSDLAQLGANLGLGSASIKLPSTTTYQLAKDFEKNQKLSIIFKWAQNKVNVNVVMIEEHKTFNGVKGVKLGF